MTTTKEALEKARNALRPFAPGGFVSVNYANELITAIESALSAQGEEWRDIETAPKDGSAILTFPHYRITHWEEEISGFARLEQKTEEWEHLKPPPTHWMPLPSPPGSAPPAPADDIAALRAENERLRAALGPFAAFAGIADDPAEPEYEKFICRGSGEPAITFGHLRRARAALNDGGKDG